ncbi:uncharacterized protein F5147DRAFT_779391 [Suillus discolor]|uniref:Uncharacterized protein n=1 Tax=Suillus discolor TaxID=1912936 RepID=A0A9P7EVW8_9AGAM|nr:uncharacterized protein F5147DRAFT_779391 [Suillus discolor]KAG2093336.1 hypothetical protein F5147DRAFT_779391 [Suillus discolor]
MSLPRGERLIMQPERIAMQFVRVAQHFLLPAHHDAYATLLGKPNAMVGISHFFSAEQTMSTAIPFVIERVFFSPQVIFLNGALSTARPELTVINQNHPRFKNAVRSLADECVLHVYEAIFYNIPVQVKPSQMVFCVMCGAHIGVVAGWENALNCVLGATDAVYYDVDSVAIGEEKVRIAIDEGHIEMVEPWASPEL